MLPTSPVDGPALPTANHDGGLLFPVTSARANPRRTRRQRYHSKPDRRLSAAGRSHYGTEAVSEVRATIRAG